MSKKAPEWKKANPERTDMKNVLNKTKKLTEMYLVLLKERKKQWVPSFLLRRRLPLPLLPIQMMMFLAVHAAANL